MMASSVSQKFRIESLCPGNVGSGIEDCFDALVHLRGLGFIRVCLGNVRSHLTRIRLQLAIYFWLYRGSLLENTAGCQPRFGAKLAPTNFRKKLYVIENSRHLDPRLIK